MKENKSQIVPNTTLFSLLIYLLSFGVWVFSYSFSTKNNVTTNSFFEKILPFSSYFAHLITFGLMLLNSVMLTRIIEKYGIIRVKTFMPNLVYVVLVTFYFPFHGNYLAQISTFLIMSILMIIFDAYKLKDATENSFLISLILSSMVIFERNWIFLLPLIWAIYKVLKSLSLKVILASLLGVITPLITIYGYNFLLDDRLLNLSFVAGNILTFSFPNFSNLPFLIYMGILMLLFIFSVLQMPLLVKQDALKPREYQFVLKLFFAFLVLFFFVKNSTILNFLPIFFILYSLLFSYSLSLKNSWFNKGIFYLFLINSIGFSYLLISQ